MTIFWPWALLTLLLVPIILGLYIWSLRRRKPAAVQFSSLSIIKQALPKRSKWRQHLPFALFLLGITSLLVSFARPAAAVQVPLSRTTIILALDVSRSMCSVDVEPNRLTVAQEAMLNFVEDQPAGTQIGLVAFAGFAEMVVPPTDDKEVLTDSISNLTVSLGTAIGSATLKSIDALAEINPDIPPSGINLTLRDGAAPDGDGEFLPDIIVLLTDGANSQGIPPMRAAERAAERDIRVFTIGFGTTDMQPMICTREQNGNDPFAEEFDRIFGSGFGNFDMDDLRPFLIIDEDTLQGVADLTGGEYYRAEDANQLVDVFQELPSQIVLQKENIEISFVFALIGAILTASGVFLSLKWSPLV